MNVPLRANQSRFVSLNAFISLFISFHIFISLISYLNIYKVITHEILDQEKRAKKTEKSCNKKAKIRKKFNKY